MSFSSLNGFTIPTPMNPITAIIADLSTFKQNKQFVSAHFVSVCKLYSDIEEIRRVYGMIRNSCLAYSIVNNKPMKNMFPFNYDEEFRYLKNKYCDYHHIYN